MKNEKFQLFSSCIPVKGASRCLIQDVQLGRSKPIPNLLNDVLEKSKSLSIEEVKLYYNGELNEGIDQYFKVLEKEGYGRIYDPTIESNAFIDIDWGLLPTHKKIENAHLKISELDPEKLKIILELLKAFGCDKLAVEFEFSVNENGYDECLSHLSNGMVDYVEVYMVFSDWMTEDKMIEYLKKYPFVVHQFIHRAPSNFKSQRASKMITNLVYYTKKIVLNEQKGDFQPVFRNNIDVFALAQHVNVFHYKKIIFNSDGSYFFSGEEADSKKNYDTPNAFDEINHHLSKDESVVQKDLIAVCKDCEFRYMCIDNRIPVNRDGYYEYNTMCTYNPYVAKFKGEEGYVPVSYPSTNSQAER